jgi:methyl-accepting chemotaxis protein
MKLRTQLILAFGVVIVVIIGLLGMTYHSLDVMTTTAQWVKHTTEVLKTANEAEKLLVDMETGARGFVITGKDEFLEPYNVGRNIYDAKLAALKALVSDNPAQLGRLTTIDEVVREWDKTVLSVQIATRRTGAEGGDKTAAEALVAKGTGKVFMDRVRKMMAEFQGEEDGLMVTRVRAADAAKRLSIRSMVISGGGGILLAVISMIVVIRGVYRQVGGEPVKIALITEQVAAGDLMVDWRNGIKEPTGILASIGKMVENLQSQIRDLRDAANVLTSSASEISASVTQVTSGAQETATAVTETTATVEEVKQGTHLTSQKSKAIADNAQQGLQMAHAGRKATETVTEGMVRINDQMTSIAGTIMKLGEQSQAIGEITATVDDIAEQSNLLAVNAAVEAAKAGEHGRGFAVVAQEIKSLAEQSKQATKQVRSILNDIQKATGAAVMATEKGSKVVDQGLNESARASELIQALSASFTDAAQSAGQIAASTQEQLTGMDQVAMAMENIKEASQQNVTSMRQLEVAAQTLKEIGHKFTESVGRYKV